MDIPINVNSAYSKGLVLENNTSTGAVTIADNETAVTTLASGTVAANSGTITVTISGQTVTANVFGTVMTGTIPSGSAALSQTMFGVNPTATGAHITIGGLTVVITN